MPEIEMLIKVFCFKISSAQNAYKKKENSAFKKVVHPVIRYYSSGVKAVKQCNLSSHNFFVVNIMENEVIILIIEAMTVYFLVLWAHSLRHRFGNAPFYALIGGLTAIMSWVTDAGVAIEVGGVTFIVGSTVFYTSLLLGVFVVYVFDGPKATRIAISTIIGVSAMVPIIAATLHMQLNLIGNAPIYYVPMPSLRINTASVFATLIDLVFLAMAWEYLGKPDFNLKLWIRAFFGTPAISGSWKAH